MESVAWEGDFRSFLEFLRTDPQFYYETGEELLDAYRAMSKKIDAYMPILFNKLPRAPYGVIPIPMESAPSLPLLTTMLQVQGVQDIFMQIYTSLKQDLNMRFRY